MRFRKGHTWPRFFKATVAAQIHLIGLVVALVSFIVFCLSPSIHGGHFYACAAFSLLGAMVMGVSALYHFLHDGLVISKRHARVFENLDHVSIYLFIAGTYTPILINAVKSTWKTPLIIIVWSVAVAGIAYTLMKSRLPMWLQSRAVYTSFFLMMGWLLVVRGGEIANNLSSTSLMLLIAGALAYTFGAVIYATKWPRLSPRVFGFHELWHIAVVMGFGFHFALILSFYGV